MKKKYKIIIIIVILIIVISLITLLILKKIENDNLNAIKKRVETLVNNSYEYYLLKNGPLPITDGYIIESDIKYYYVDNNNVNSFEKIKKMVEETFTKSVRNNMLKDIYEGRKYIESDNKLYAELVSEEICKIDYKIDINTLKLEKQDDKTYIVEFENTANYIFYEDGQWYLSVPLYSCFSDSGEK